MLHQRTSRHTPKTLEYYDYVLGKLMNWLRAQGISTVQQVETGTMRKFVLYLQDNLGANSVRTVLRGTRAFFSFMVKEEFLEKDPMVRVKTPLADKTIL
ncbi:site-specific integrase, partial [Armatimonas sp.]|uniref:site-specific integrase n=1 Tax=Armatimonas sp. TaxID=1872638 RepID=UPI00286A0C78